MFCAQRRSWKLQGRRLLRNVEPGFRRTLLTKSSVVGSLEPPLSLQTLPDFFNTEILSNHAHLPALICRQEKPRAHGGPPSRNLDVQTHLSWDYEEFDRHIGALARGLIGMGVKKGDRVGVIMGNNSSYAMLQWACASVGAILVTLNPAYRLPELVDTLALSGVSHLFITPRIRSSSYIRLFAEAFAEIRSQQPGDIQTPILPELNNLVVVRNEAEADAEAAKVIDELKLRCTVDWREVMMWTQGSGVREEKERRMRERQLTKDDIVNLQFTSGTTGSPKAVSLTHSNLLNNGISIGQAMNLTEKDILCNVPPLFHCFGLVLGNLAAWTHGSCVVYAAPVLDPPAIVDAIVEERCTALHGVPTHFLGVLEEVKKRNAWNQMGSLRTGIAAGSPVPIDLMKRLIDGLNLTELTVAYGMTETSPVSFQSTAEDAVIKRVETVGKIRPHVKAKIVGSDGNVVDVGKPGEILVAGYLLQKGYWNDQNQTEQVMKEDQDGTLWMHTGDEGIMDEEGYLKIVGRIKDIIIRGGENLFPVQIENATTVHPDIREAAAISVPDMKYGEVVGVWIVREPGSKISREDVRTTVMKSINPQNAPAWVWFIGEDGESKELPKTASGKVMKHILRAWGKGLSERGVGRAC
ncbi:acyl-CoA synthetase [Crepidotus variabilis]|uniref:Acyl-CoA synthetase n=1 Tax=Crepidotus variabilis TaxID=179855 RepID=A0A9P6E670_9AGAR|nr:acyl-CoA synthetase [Crepidotus variabilis]